VIIDMGLWAAADGADALAPADGAVPADTAAAVVIPAVVVIVFIFVLVFVVMVVVVRLRAGGRQDGAGLVGDGELREAEPLGLRLRWHAQERE
jgi:heme/copper-type cytochrome/quinol oxidase subunit 2